MHFESGIALPKAGLMGAVSASGRASDMWGRSPQAYLVEIEGF